MLSTEEILDTFVSAADSLVHDFDVVDFLHMLVLRTAAIAGAAEAGILLTDGNGNLTCMAASDDDAQLLEVFQAQLEEGPCHDAFNSGEPVVNLELSSAADRWPVFVPKALAMGYESVHALPMRLRTERLGALNLFSPRAVEFDDEGLRIVQALADIATIAIIQERSIRLAEDTTSKLQGALVSRIVIEQAKGILAEHSNTNPDQAFVLLRSYARQNRSPLREVCEWVVNDPSATDELLDPPIQPGNPLTLVTWLQISPPIGVKPLGWYRPAEYLQVTAEVGQGAQGRRTSRQWGGRGGAESEGERAG